MSDLLDITSLIFLVIAVLIFLKLRSVLGQRTGTERPPFDPYKLNRPKPSEKKDADPDAQIISFPSMETATVDTIPTPQERIQAHRIVDRVSPKDTSLNQILHKLVDEDPNWSVESFLEGAEIAYETIIDAFAQGERETLRALLSEKAYKGFDSVITLREKEDAESYAKLIALKTPEFLSASLKEDMIEITLLFTAKILSYTQDRTGRIIDGDETEAIQMRDVWTFSRPLVSVNPNWKLVQTASQEEEADGEEG